MTPEQTLRELFATSAVADRVDASEMCAIRHGAPEWTGITLPDFFIHYFYTMLTLDIGEMETMIDILPEHRNSYENGVWVALTKAKSILEARREALNK